VSVIFLVFKPFSGLHDVKHTMPKKVKKKKSDSAEDVTVTEAEAGIPSDAPPPKPKKKLDSKSQGSCSELLSCAPKQIESHCTCFLTALLEAVNESNAEDNARRDSQLNDNALKLGLLVWASTFCLFCVDICIDFFFLSRRRT
jgi:hypothetical protein